MGRVPIIFPIVLTAFVLFGISSCTPEACFEETNAFLKASFYDNETKKLRAPDSLTIYGVDASSGLIYDKSLKIQPALFPLNPSVNSCTFVVKINGVTDTLRFVYSSYPHLVSKECGYSIYHDLDTMYHTGNIINYIYRSNNRITTKNEENIRLFY